MSKFDLVVIGAGPGGYVAALRAAQLGLKVACIDDNDQPGGTCLRVGCIPSKALLESSEHFEQSRLHFEDHGIKIKGVDLDLGKMLARKDQVVAGLTKGIEGLLKKNKVTHYKGRGSILAVGKVRVEGGGKTEELETNSILIATGSRSADLKGVQVDGENIGTSTEALSYDKVPDHLVVIGAGYIGLELGTVWRRLGSKVTVFEYLDRILPGMDLEIANEAQKIFEKQGIQFQLGCRVTGTTVKKKGQILVEIEGRDPVKCDKVLLAVGRVPNTKGLGLENVNVTTDQRGRIIVDETYETNVGGIYAIGDVIPGPMLAHKAEEEGVAVAEYLATGHGHVNYEVIPGVVYTDPEIATVGHTEEALKDKGIEYKKGVFPFRANGRARALNMVDGKVKVLADAKTDRILGVHIIGPRAGDLIAEAVMAMEFHASSEDLARTCHAHPTLSEVVKEAALAVDQRAIHM